MDQHSSQHDQQLQQYCLVTEQSRKSRSAKQTYEAIRQKLHKSVHIPDGEWNGIKGRDGIQVPESDRFRVLNIRLHEEYLSPYFKTDMNLFQLHMLDENATMSMYRSDQGWLFVFEGVSALPRPFGQNGFDTR
jgi:hypothetical protein